MPIREMTSEEIRKALRHGAQVCVEDESIAWWSKDTLPQDGAYETAARCLDNNWRVEDSPEHAATFLLLVAEAHEC